MLLRDDGLIRRTSGRRMTDKASFFSFFPARSDTGFGGNIRGNSEEIKSGVKRNADGSYEVTYGGLTAGRIKRHADCSV